MGTSGGAAARARLRTRAHRPTACPGSSDPSGIGARARARLVVIEGPAAVRNKLGGAFFDRLGRFAGLGRQVDTPLGGGQGNAIRELAQAAGTAGGRPELPT